MNMSCSAGASMLTMPSLVNALTVSSDAPPCNGPSSCELIMTFGVVRWYLRTSAEHSDMGYCRGAVDCG